jgi:hypothetical protein
MFVAGAVLVGFAAATSVSHVQSGRSSIDCRQRADGKWAVDSHAPTTAVVILQCGYTLSSGPGWEVWSVKSKAVPLGGATKLTPSQIDAIAHAAWVSRVENPSDATGTRAFEMLRDGVATRTVGAVYYLRIVAPWLGLALIAAAVVLMLAWLGRVLRAKMRIGRIDLGLCGRCKYPILRVEIGPRRCSECGADIGADYAAAWDILKSASPGPGPAVTL